MGKLAEKMWRMCLRKKKYKSEFIANSVAQKVKEERGVILYSYCCPLCGYWHLTKKERLTNDNKKHN